MTSIDAKKYRGTKVEKTKQELEQMGYNVKICNNFQREMDNSQRLVVDIKQSGEKSLTIVAGSFKFLA